VTSMDYEFLRKLLKERSGLDLSSDKQYLVESRLTPLARRVGLSDIAELVAKIKSGSEALTLEVVEAMTTNETFFFRDKIPFDHLRQTVLPELVQARANRRSLRIWCAASSTGQEPYSIAMSIKEFAPLAGWRVEIVATDLSQGVLEKSRAGIFSQFEVQRGLPIQMLVTLGPAVDRSCGNRASRGTRPPAPSAARRTAQIPSPARAVRAPSLPLRPRLRAHAAAPALSSPRR
jgi:chemotaxis protein methyltransferase CheR